jgi:putative Holliday junction resolvase
MADQTKKEDDNLKKQSTNQSQSDREQKKGGGGRILSIDYGGKRTGLAVTDPLKIIATGLGTVESPKLISFLKDYFSKEAVELVIIGMPTNWDDSATHATPLVQKFVKQFQKDFPSIPIKEVDERFTSKLASQAMLQMGMKKKQRQNKAMIDEIAATIMLQEYLQHNL